MTAAPEQTRRSAPARRRGGSGSGGETEERILDAAEACFARKGYAGTTLRDVADAVGIRIPSLYNHFSSKENLYRAVLERGIAPIMEALGRFVAEEPVRPGAIPRVILSELAARPNIPKLVQYELLSGGDQLANLVQRFMTPAVAQGLSLLQSGPAARGWKPEELPMLLIAFYNMTMGHFTTGPLYELLCGDDPLAPETIERQARFFDRVVDLLAAGSEEPDEGS